MEWKRLNGIVVNGDNYSVSSIGLVRNDKSDKLLTPSKNAKGYLEVWLSFNNKVKKYRVNRLVALAFIPNPEDKEQVNHKDGNKENNYKDNLEWTTCSENLKHAYRENLNSQKGDRSSAAKLSEDDVRAIKRLLFIESKSIASIARRYEVHPSTISLIKSGKNWSYVTVEE
jgi:hypothetical protein